MSNPNPEVKISLILKSLERLEEELSENDKKNSFFTFLSKLIKKYGSELLLYDEMLDKEIREFDESSLDDFKARIVSYAEPVLIYPIYQLEDYTIYLKRKKGDIFETLTKQSKKKGRGFSYEGRLRLVDSNKDEKGVEKENLSLNIKERLTDYARVLVCSCSKGEYWSITIRKGRTEQGHHWYSTEDRENALLEARANNQFRFGYQPKGNPKVESNDSKKQKIATQNSHTKQARDIDNSKGGSENEELFLNTVYQISHHLYEKIFWGNETKTGLVVLTGSTSSGKSQVGLGLIYEYLGEKLKRNGQSSVRNPHLVTFEDPIEKFYFKDQKDKPVPPDETQKYGIDCTLREKPKDGEVLEDIFKDLLRQTPSIVLIGETRRVEDWKALIEFAGTGHLVFTTAHAGSLTEAMGKIFEATNSKTAAQRAIIADRLLALIHIKGDKIRVEDVGGIKILIPALWRRTTSGAKALMAEGRSSLLPYNPSHEQMGGNSDEKKSDSQEVDNPHTLGRRWFAEELVKQALNSEELFRQIMARLHKNLQSQIEKSNQDKKWLERWRERIKNILMKQINNQAHLNPHIKQLFEKRQEQLKKEVIKKAIGWDMEGI